jgi:hypothetical protein
MSPGDIREVDNPTREETSVIDQSPRMSSSEDSIAKNKI